MLLLRSFDLVTKFKQELKTSVSLLKKDGIEPKLTIILANNNPSSKIYVRNKLNFCAELGIQAEMLKFDPETTNLELLLEAINKLNNSKHSHGIICQLPLPFGIDEGKIAEAIAPAKDVDCFHPFNVGKLFNETSLFEPCTPKGIIKLLEYYNIPCIGKNIVIVGRSKIVGKTLGIMLLRRNISATVTVCHSQTFDIKKICSGADILIAAIGKANLINSDYVKDQSTVIDVGINRLQIADKKFVTVGDVDFESVKSKVKAISPVPGGVGPLTVTMLITNLIAAARFQN